MEKEVEEKKLITLPLLGDPAPDFEADTTFGKKRLADYKGKWLVLFSHPADFTPVCTTEFIAFAQIYDELKKRNTELMGLSVDSTSSHIAWARNIEEKVGVKIPFPIIADLSKEVATKYGMLHPSQSATATVRCVFFIDPEGILRAMLYYPLTNGRNMDEIVRMIDAFQTSDKFKVATPANWRPGDDVVVPAPKTQQDAEKRVKEGYECVDWYLCKKKL
jgi:peroxiredoxin (alkyl hydroperoxide reductase subunit C)